VVSGRTGRKFGCQVPYDTAGESLVIPLIEPINIYILYAIITTNQKLKYYEFGMIVAMNETNFFQNIYRYLYEYGHILSIYKCCNPASLENIEIVEMKLK
jgi:hypothetical protein